MLRVPLQHVTQLSPPFGMKLHEFSESKSLRSTEEGPPQSILGQSIIERTYVKVGVAAVDLGDRRAVVTSVDVQATILE